MYFSKGIDKAISFENCATFLHTMYIIFYSAQGNLGRYIQLIVSACTVKEEHIKHLSLYFPKAYKCPVGGI